MKKKDMQLKGFTYDHDKFEVLKKQHWVKGKLNITHCTKHNTYFCQEDEPCWQCYNECEEEVL